MLKNLKKYLVFILILPCMFIFTSCKDDKNIDPPAPETYNITYVLNGGENNSNNPVSFTEESESIVLASPTKANYEFSGWYLEDNFNTVVTEIVKGSTGNKTFYAKWTPTLYQITYVLNGGENSLENPNSFTVESETIIFANPSFDAYEFDGWYLDSNFNSKITQIEKGTSGNKTLYAKWKNVVYEISYELNGGTNNTTNPNSYTIDSETIVLDNPTKTGYDFLGWFADSDFEEQVLSIVKGSTGNKSFYAKWTSINYSITYELNGGENSPENPVYYTIEDTIILKTPTRVGYNFDSWYLNASLSVSVTEIIAGSTGNISLYANWVPKTYKVLFDYNGADGNNTIEGIDVAYGNEIGTLPAPEKTDFVFAGWWRNNIEYNENIEFNFVEDIKLTALWIPVAATLTYTVEFNSNGGTDVESITDIAFASKIERPTNPTRVGYSFDGWLLGDLEWDFDTNLVTENITLSASWLPNRYTIFYVLNEGENNPENPSEYTIEDAVVLKEATREEYDFLGWYLDAEFTEQITEISQGSHRDLVLYANWHKREITKSTADLSIVFNLPNEIDSLYTDTVITASVGSRQELQSFNNVNLGNYFLGYYYIDEDGNTVELEGNIYPVETSIDRTIYARWNNAEILKYYYSDGITIVVSGDRAVVDYYSGSSSEVFIPEYYRYNNQDYPLNNFADGSFSNNIFISRINFLPRTSLIEVGNNAFLNSSLSYIDFNYISRIGKSAFSGTRISELVSSNNLLNIDESAFSNCTSLTLVDLSNVGIAFSTIEQRTFSGCVNLVNILVSSNLRYIMDYAFEGCVKLTSIDFMESMRSGSFLNNYAFKDCTGLTSVKISEKIENIGTNIFMGCENLKTFELTRTFAYSYGTRFIDLFGINSVETIVISGIHITVIPSLYFDSLTNMTTLRMSDNVEIIEENAFSNCPILSDIYLSKGLDLSKFNINAFAGTYWYNRLNDLLIIDNTLVYIPNTENLTQIVIPNGVTAISESVAFENENITYVFIPKSVKTISESAFSDCYNLTTIEFESGSELEEIGSYAFSYCSLLENISLENCSNLKVIGNRAFYYVGYDIDGYVGGENGFVLPNSLMQIGDSAFLNLRVNKFIANGNYFVSDENGILYGVNQNDEKISIVVAPSSYKSEFYILPSTIKKIYSFAFYNCRNIEYVYIDNSVLIGVNPFNKSTTVLTGDNAIISFENPNLTISTYSLTNLETEYEYSYENGEYDISVTEDTEDGYYLIRLDQNFYLIRVQFYSGEKRVIILMNLTDYIG